MKPRPFGYVAATSLEQVLDLLADTDQDMKVLSGGQSLIPTMNFGLARPGILVDINRVPGLAYITEEAEGIAVGGMTRHYEVEDSPAIRRAFPVITEAVRHVGHRAIRHRGTVGGSLAHADPSAEWGALAQVLEVELTIQKKGSSRTVKPDEFFRGPLTTCVEPDELLTGIRIPYLPDGARSAFYEVARRSGDFALVGVAAIVKTDQTGLCTFARLALCGVGPIPLRARRAEAALVGVKLTQSAVAEAARLASLECDPDSDIHGSVEYRKVLAGVCVRRAVSMAAGEPDLARSVMAW